MKKTTLNYYQYYCDEIIDNKSSKLLKSEAKKLSESIAHDVPTLDNILNNQLKQGMTLWRVEENHNLPSLLLGKLWNSLISVQQQYLKKVLYGLVLQIVKK